MKQKRISFGQGKGSLTHNNREFVANNVDTSRIPDNVTFKCQPIGEAYQQLFGESTERYNAKQKRNDRKIHGTYYESLFHQKPSNSVVTAADKRKSFYEDVVQVGKMEDSGYGTEDFQLVADCLKEYMNGFQERNPNFYVFNAVLHMDEATPHLHIDYIPVGHYKRGQDTQNGIAQALKEMGYGEGKNAIARWRAAEIEVINKICLAYGIEPLAPEKSRGTLEIPEYKEQRKKADELAKENEQKENQLAKTTSALDAKNAELKQKEKQVNELLNFLPDVEKEQQVEHLYNETRWQLDDLLKSPMSIIRNKDSIKEQIDKLEKITKKALDAVNKYSMTVYSLRELCAKYKHGQEEDKAKIRDLSDRNRELSRQKNEMSSKNEYLIEVCEHIDRSYPFVLEKAKDAVRERQECEEMREQQESERTKKKHEWSL
jgi:hypothetical protein